MSLAKAGWVNVWAISSQSQTDVPDDISNVTAIRISGYLCATII